MGRQRHAGISDQRKASLHRMADAQALFEKGRWRGAMYLAGYAAECRLKYKLMRQWNCFSLQELEESLTKRGMNRSLFTHNLYLLLMIVGGVRRMESNRSAWSAFLLLNAWQPSWRYNPDLSTSAESQAFLAAAASVIIWVENNC